MSEDVNEENFGITEEFLEDIRNDTKINDLDLRNEGRTISNRTQRYIEEFYRQRRRLKKTEVYLKKVEGELFSYYKTDFEIKITSSADIMKFVQKDKKYLKAVKIYNEVECVVDFLERVIKNMNNNSWMVQKLIDMDKLGV